MLKPPPEDLLLAPEEDLVLEPVERLLEPDERDTEPVERLLEPLDTEPEERVEPLFTADEDRREPEVVAVLEPALVALVEPVPLIERELTDLEETPASERVVSPVEASLEPTDLVEATLAPEACATDLVEALLTAAATPSILREPLVANEPDARAVEVAVPPATVEPPLRPYTTSLFLLPPPS